MAPRHRYRLLLRACRNVGALAAVLVLSLGAGDAARAEPVAVRFIEGVTRGFLTVHGLDGKSLGQGDITQLSRNGRLESRMVLRFLDGSLHDEEVVFTQNKAFALVSYKLTQKGPSFPEAIKVSLMRETGEYLVQSRKAGDKKEEEHRGKLELPADTYNGLLLDASPESAARTVGLRPHGCVDAEATPDRARHHTGRRGSGEGRRGDAPLAALPDEAQARARARDSGRGDGQDASRPVLLGSRRPSPGLRGVRGAAGKRRARVAHWRGQPRPARAGDATMKAGTRATFREAVARGFSTVEDVVYIVLALLLAASLAALLVDAALTFARAFANGFAAVNIVPFLDRALLVLMVVEILYTVQVSFREHVLVPEPFLLVALIAAVRRVIVLTAELGELARRGGEAFRAGLIETALITGVVLALAAALVVLKRHPQAVAERA